MSDELPPRRNDPRRVVPRATDGPIRGDPVGPASAEAGGPASAEVDRVGDGDGWSAPNRRALGLAIVAVLVILVLAALIGGSAPPGGATFPPAGATPGVAGGAAAVTRGEVVRALGSVGIQVEGSTRAYRPAEAPGFASAPRIVVRAILPEDPDHGLIVIYEFVDAAEASAAAEAQAAYVASGVGRVQFSNDTRFVIRTLGSTAIFYAWSAAAATDPRAAALATALETVGVGIPVPG